MGQKAFNVRKKSYFTNLTSKQVYLYTFRTHISYEQIFAENSNFLSQFLPIE